MKKKPTGKVRTVRTARKPPAVAEVLPPFDPNRRHSVKNAQRYLEATKPTVYKLIHEGLLVAFKEGNRTYITGQSLAARMVPPADGAPVLRRPGWGGRPRKQTTPSAEATP